jgi:hypothetical protein
MKLWRYNILDLKNIAVFSSFKNSFILLNFKKNWGVLSVIDEFLYLGCENWMIKLIVITFVKIGTFDNKLIMKKFMDVMGSFHDPPTKY